jgi:hypothetical protein
MMTRECAAAKRMREDYVGQPIEKLISALGAPASKTEVPSGWIYGWDDIGATHFSGVVDAYGFSGSSRTDDCRHWVNTTKEGIVVEIHWRDSGNQCGYRQRWPGG